MISALEIHSLAYSDASRSEFSGALMDAKSTKPRLSADHIRQAILVGSIWPAFQPLVDLKSNSITGFEVLARWTDDDLGLISPSEFIPAAEACGIIDELSRHIMATACQEAVTWPGQFTLAFNISPLQFKNALLFEDVVKTVSGANFPLRRVQIEITEGAVLENEYLALATVERLKAAGVALALDDFGTGFASLSRLHAFPFDKLKIDTSFVRTLDTDAASRKIVTSVIGLGLSLGMCVVAEGVETAVHADILKKLGCSKGQGWYFGRPADGKSAAALLSGQKPHHSDSVTLDVSPFQRLHQLDELYRASPVGLCFLDQNFVHVSVNERFANIMGLTPEIMIGGRVWDFFPEENAKEITHILERVMESETVRVDEFVAPITSNTCLILCKRVDDEAGTTLGISVTAIDITDRKHIENSLRHLEEHIAWTTDSGTHIFWAADGDGNVSYIGPLTEGASNSVGELVANFRERIHPDDSIALKLLWAKHVVTGEPFEICYRVMSADGHYEWVQSRAKSQRGTNGKVTRWYGIIENIHNQRNLENRVRELEAKLNELCFFEQRWARQVQAW